MCVSNCKKYNKYYFKDERVCLDSCYKKNENNENIYLFYDESDFRCYISCPEIKKYFIKIPEMKYHQKYLTNCPSNYQYHFENDFECYKNCDLGFYKYDSNELCVHICGKGEFVVGKNKCVQKCPEEEKYIAFVSNVTRCVSNCLEYGYNYYYKDTCLLECNATAPLHFRDRHECIKECPIGYYRESDLCLSNCISNTYFIKEGDSYKCLQNCDLTKYYISSTGECVEKCKIGENYIGKNKTCKSHCEAEDGIYFINVQNESDYKIYLCRENYGNYMDNSGINHIEYIVDGTKEIVTDYCPPEKPYASENEYKCYSNCRNNELLKFTTEKEGKKICSSQCITYPYLYYDNTDKICIENCEIYPNNIINEENYTCVYNCDTSSLYKFKTQKEENGRFYCSTECLLNKKKNF